MTQQQPSLVNRVEEEAETNGCLGLGSIYRSECEASPRAQLSSRFEDAQIKPSDLDHPTSHESQESRTPEDQPQTVAQRSHREEGLEPNQISSSESQESREIRHQGKRSLAEKSVTYDRSTKIRRIGGPNPTNAEPVLPTSSTLLCPRCEALDLKVPKGESPSFKIIAKLGDVTELLSKSECGLCQLLSRVRPTASSCNTGGILDCSLVQFDGSWARPWKSGPPSKVDKDCPPYNGRCFDTFATMDTQIMFGVLPSKGVESPRSNTVPYLHDRLFESLTRSGYIRALQGPARANSEVLGPKLVGKIVDWNFIRTCVKNARTSTPKHVVQTSLDGRYLALSYVWGAEQSAESIINQDMLPDSMPTTILDAIEVTLKLALEYLWVDRYCIPQDQEAVKHREIRHMDLIYRRAAATIVACAGMGPWYGLPGVLSRLRSGSDCVRIGDQVLFSVPPDPRYGIEASDWMNRGWTYQEGILSKRRIFFTEEQVYFECDARHCFESTAPLFNNVFWEASQKPRIFAIGGKAISGPDFYKTVSEYSGRKLTYESDILNGVWGVLRTFQDTEYPIRHYWGVPLFSLPSRYEYMAGFAWDLMTPSQRRPGFPSWSWTGWLGQVKPALLVQLDHASTPSQGSSSDAPTPGRPLSTYHSAPPSIIPSQSPESNTVVTPEDILQINLPEPVRENIAIWAIRMDGCFSPYLPEVMQYSNYGGHGLSRFLHIKCEVALATLSTSGQPKVTISPASRHSSSLNVGSHYESLEWLPTMDEPTPLKSRNPDRPCRAILLAKRKPLVERRRNPKLPFPSINNINNINNEGEVINNSWLCLFMIVEHKGSELPGGIAPWFERIGLAKFMFPGKMSMQALTQDLDLQYGTITLG